MGQQHLLLGALQQQADGRLAPRLPQLGKNPHLGASLLGDLTMRREIGCTEWVAAKPFIEQAQGASVQMSHTKIHTNEITWCHTEEYKLGWNKCSCFCRSLKNRGKQAFFWIFIDLKVGTIWHICKKLSLKKYFSICIGRKKGGGILLSLAQK